jgi:TatD DNase family protein
MIVDSHTHLEMPEFADDRDEVVERARTAGIEFMVTVGTNIAYCREVVSLAERYDGVYAAVGIHPHDVKEIGKDTYEELRALARRKKVVAYGEIGLDFFRNLSPRNIQVQRFGEQLELACEIGLPVIVHDRDAHREALEMLTPWRGKLRGIFHCFSGDRAMAKKCLDMGFVISVPGTVTFAKAETLRDVVRYVPLEYLLVETDAPYLTPQPHRGKRNEPAYVVHTVAKVAEVKELSAEAVGAATTANAKALFGVG